LSQATYVSQSQSLVNASVAVLPQNRTPAELVEIMAARLCDIKEKHPMVDLGASEGLCQKYLTGRGKIWLDMERELASSKF
jgi:hypothetical protein